MAKRKRKASTTSPIEFRPRLTPKPKAGKSKAADKRYEEFREVCAKHRETKLAVERVRKAMLDKDGMDISGPYV